MPCWKHGGPGQRTYVGHYAQCVTMIIIFDIHVRSTVYTLCKAVFLLSEVWKVYAKVGCVRVMFESPSSPPYHKAMYIV